MAITTTCLILSFRPQCEIPSSFRGTSGSWIQSAAGLPGSAQWHTPGRCRPTCVSPFPVSYTHLDVYKRQPQSLPDRLRHAEGIDIGRISHLYVLAVYVTAVLIFHNNLHISFLQLSFSTPAGCFGKTRMLSLIHI